MPIWSVFISALNDLAAILGPDGAATLVVIVVGLVLGFVLVSLYMILHFGHEAANMFLPFITDSLRVLRSESAKTHLAIKLEMRFQQFLGAIIVLCLLATVVHALASWIPNKTEPTILGALITSALLFFGLGCVSLNLSLRLK